MDLPGLLNDLLFDHTLRTVALGAATLGVVSGALGSFAVLRKQSLLGDAMSHAALPGVVIAFLLTRSKEPLVLIFGAVLAGWIATLVVMGIVNSTRIKYDSALGIALSVFFGLGIMLLTFTQKLPDARQAGLNTFLFGQAAALLQRDVLVMASLGTVALLLMGIFWKEFKLLSFDVNFGASLGFPMRFLDILLTTLLVIAIVIGLQAVGVVLMSAMIVAPAAAARQWTDRLGYMVALSALFGALAGVSGAMISSLVPGLSTGPTIVLSISFIVLLSLLFAPNRGLIWNWVRRQRDQRSIRLSSLIQDLYALDSQHRDHEHGHSLAALRAMNFGHADVRRSIEVLEERGWAYQVIPGEWALTPSGQIEAERVLETSEMEGR
ncbi:MAG: iron chelate uptake ABC transporter family permease subunit [Anaerolineales bacterium]|nr:iron chelate uptake ABC transporter family permease subunit [Anaerolineales bacterium]